MNKVSFHAVEEDAAVEEPTRDDALGILTIEELRSSTTISPSQPGGAATAPL